MSSRDGKVAAQGMRVEAQSSGRATPAQREQFERDGYLVLEDAVAPDRVLDSIVAALADLYGKPLHERDGVVYYRNRIQDAWRVDEHVKALALAPPVLALIEDLHGRRPLPFQTINFRIGSQQKAHSDALHFSSKPEGFMCGVWVALEDVDAANGPLVYYPGSHGLPFQTMADAGLEASSDQYAEYELHIERLIARERLEPRHGTIRKGQAIVWAANLLHGGAPQEDRTRSRHSQVTHYFFEGCRYWAPMVSEGSDIRWREPQWIA
jgi:ectoine hydroxylase-related dioxygenase (phytanoyl-CoA dioxygenase family)